MAARRGVLRRLAAKYVPAITPGYLLEPGLGGNVKRRSRRGVDHWRAAFLQARSEYGVAGFGTYELHGANGYRQALRPMFRAFADGLRAGASR